MKRFLILTIFLSLILGWLALRVTFEESFTEGLLGQPVDLIPGQGAKNPVDSVLENLLYRPLFSYDKNNQIKPDLVKSYSVSRDGRIYTITIGDFFWRDGRPITSTDVIFTFVQDPAFAEIGIEQEGDKKIRFLLANPLASFLNVLTAPIAPAHFRNLSVSELGSSHYFIKELRREAGRTSQIILGSDSKEQTFQELVLKFFNTEDDLISAAQKGEIDAFSAEKEFRDDSFISYTISIFSRYFVIFFNFTNGNTLVRDRSFRLAARSATPHISGLPVIGPFSGTWAQNSWPVPKVSKKKFTGTMELTAVDTSEFRHLTKKIKEVWERKLKIKVSLKLVSERQLEEILAKRDFAAIILGQEVNRDPDRYNLWHSTQREYPGQNVSGWANGRADRALEEARKTLKRAERLFHYKNFQRLFGEDNPAVFLYHPAFNYYVSKNFKGVDLTKIFDPSERFWNFSQWERSVSF